MMIIIFIDFLPITIYYSATNHVKIIVKHNYQKKVKQAIHCANNINC